MISSPQYYCLHFTWKQTHWRSDRYWQERELWDSNSDLSCFGARVLLWSCSAWRGEQRESSLSRLHCQHRHVHTQSHTHRIWGFHPHSANEVRGNPTTQKCLRIVSSFSDQVIRRMSMCPKSPKMEPNLTGLQSFNGIQLNILPLFTPLPLTNNHNQLYKLQPSLRVWALQITWVCWFKWMNNFF